MPHSALLRPQRHINFRLFFCGGVRRAAGPSSWERIGRRGQPHAAQPSCGAAIMRRVNWLRTGTGGALQGRQVGSASGGAGIRTRRSHHAARELAEDGDGRRAEDR